MRINYILIYLLLFSCANGFKRKPSSEYESESEFEYRFYSTQTLERDFEELPSELKPFFLKGGPLDRAFGVLSPNGPLGKNGPIGRAAWNVTPYLNLVGPWVGLRKELTENAGPLSEVGPTLLRSSPVQEIFKLYRQYSPYPFDILLKSLEAGAPLSFLGEDGFLGPLGLLGPFGPNGATGYVQNERGNYVDERGNVVKKVSLKTVDGKRNFDMYELYENTGIVDIENSDANFSLNGKIGHNRESDIVNFVTTKEGFHSIGIIPDSIFDAFDLTIKNEAGDVITKTSSNQLFNGLSIELPPNTKVSIVITHNDISERILRMNPFFNPKINPFLPTRNKYFRLFVNEPSHLESPEKQSHQYLYDVRKLTLNRDSCATQLRNILI